MEPACLILMSVNYEILSAFVLATGLLSISPGPDIIFVLTQGISHGRKFGLATTAGLMSGCLVHTTLLAFGISALIKSNPYLFFFIKLFGAIYLFYLAIMAYRSSGKLAVYERDTPKKSLWRLFRQGFFMNVLNPKVTVFFLAFFPGFLFSDELGLVVQFYILGAIFILVSFMVFAAVAILAGGISNYIQSHSGLGQILKWVQVIVYSGIGFYLLLSGN